MEAPHLLLLLPGRRAAGHSGCAITATARWCVATSCQGACSPTHACPLLPIPAEGCAMLG